MTSFKTLLAVSGVLFSLSAGAAFAASAEPMADTMKPMATDTMKPAADTMKPMATDTMKPMATDKMMKPMSASKTCSAEADKQGLHGKARKAFRKDCMAKAKKI